MKRLFRRRKWITFSSRNAIWSRLL